MFSKMYQGFECRPNADGSLWVLLSITRDREWPQYQVKNYRPNGNRFQKEIGAYYGVGGWYDPVICDLSNRTLETQVFVSNDYGRMMQYHELTSLSYSNGITSRVQYPGGISKTSLKHIRKTNDTTASAFSFEWSSDGEPIGVKFLKDFTLYPLWPDDYTGPFLIAETLWESETPATFLLDERIKNSNFMAALYRHWEDENWAFVCVDNEKVLFETTNIVAGDIENLTLHATDEQFVLCWQEPQSQDLFIQSYHPTTNVLSSAEVFYSGGASELDAIAYFQIGIGGDNIYLQIPQLKSPDNSEPQNWASLIRHTLKRDDLMIQETVTPIEFPGSQRFATHRIVVDDEEPHSIIVTRDRRFSQLFYYGSLNIGSSQ